MNGIITRRAYRKGVKRGHLRPHEWRRVPVGYVHVSMWPLYWRARWPLDACTGAMHHAHVPCTHDTEA